MKVCVECGKQFDDQFRSHKSKYCGEECKKKVRSRVQKINRDKRRIKMQFGSDEYIGTEVFKKYRQRALRRELEFKLNSQDFIDAVPKPCYYCKDNYKGVGFDRFDNTKGYILSNVVPCCTMCNMMKRHYSHEEFITHCKKIVQNF